MTCSCRLDSSIRARTKPTASSGTTRVSDIGSPASGGAPSWSQRPSGWWTSALPCSPASLETTGSPTSYLCSPKTLQNTARAVVDQQNAAAAEQVEAVAQALDTVTEGVEHVLPQASPYSRDSVDRSGR